MPLLASTPFSLVTSTPHGKGYDAEIDHMLTQNKPFEYSLKRARGCHTPRFRVHTENEKPHGRGYTPKRLPETVKTVRPSTAAGR